MPRSKKELPIPDVLKHALSDSLRETADSGVALIEKDTSLFDTLYELSFTLPYPYCMRSARILLLYCEKHKNAFDPYMQEITEKIKSSKIGGIKRSYLKIIYACSGIEKINDPGLLVDLSFKWLLSQNEDLAVRYYCMEILYLMIKTEPLLKNEFCATLEIVSKIDLTNIKQRATIMLNEILKSK